MWRICVSFMCAAQHFHLARSVVGESAVLTYRPSTNRYTAEAADQGVDSAMAKTSLDKSKIKILLLEGVHQSAVDNLHNAGYSNIEHLPTSLDEDTLIEKIRDVHFVGIRSRTQLNARVFDAAEFLGYLVVERLVHPGEERGGCGPEQDAFPVHLVDRPLNDDMCAGFQRKRTRLGTCQRL